MSVINDSYSLSRGYDAGNRPLSHTFADGHSQVWTYDARNLVTNLSYDGEQVLAQSHDAGYRLSTQTLGNGLSRQLTYGRSDNLRTSDVTSDTGVISSLAWNYTYNVDKQVTAETTAGSFLDDSSFTAIMPSILSRHKVSTFFLQKVILKKAEILSPVVDPGDRLVSWTRPSQVAIGSRETENWSYDNAGNHNSVTRDGTTQNRTHNTDNELINVAGDATTRDVKGNMTEDAEGNKYFYDLEHGRRIGGWVDKSRSDGGKARASQAGLASHNRINRIEMDGGDTIELEYDALGRRVFRKNGSDETAFLWWGDQECSEHVSGAGQPVIQNDLWAHPTALNKICARAVDGSKNDIEWYHKNYLDHVYAVSDDNGNIDEHYRYTAFGEVEIYNTLGQKLAQSAIGNTVMWNSRRFDQDTNLYYYKYRHYKADYGRWLGRDPIQENGGYNLYGFVGNEPIGRWDRLGLAVSCESISPNIAAAAAQGWSAAQIRAFFGVSIRVANAAVRCADGIIIPDSTTDDKTDDKTKTKTKTKTDTKTDCDEGDGGEKICVRSPEYHIDGKKKEDQGRPEKMGGGTEHGNAGFCFFDCPDGLTYAVPWETVKNPMYRCPTKMTQTRVRALATASML